MSERTERADSLTAGLPTFQEQRPDSDELSIDVENLEEWHRLSARMVAVDLVSSVLAMSPAFIAVLFFNAALDGGTLWPLVVVAVIGVLSAVYDIVRWIVTRFRITDDHVIIKTGLLIRQHRSIRRDRIRSVDIEAKLRHRVAGLKVVKVGAGQQTTAGESAIELDAVRTADAMELRYLLTRRVDREAQVRETESEGIPVGASAAAVAVGDESAADAGSPGSTGSSASAEKEVFQVFRPSWVIYNVLNIWSIVFAVGSIWGASWLLGMFGVDIGGWLTDLVDWSAIGWFWSGLIIVAALTVVGALGLAVNYFVEYWKFELARVPGEKGTLLRTERGLFTRREVNREDNRMRGVQVLEPLFWRWMGAADTMVITTGLSVWSMSAPMVILPRGPVREAKRVSDKVLMTDEKPFDSPLHSHPKTALRRRLWWSGWVASGLAVILAIVIAEGWVETSLWWLGLIPFALAPLAALIAYRALGHAIVGPFLVVRSGLLSRDTAVLQRSAVSTIVLRESILQRRLGLKSVIAATAAGLGSYAAPDLAESDALEFADQAAPGLLAPFVVQSPGTTNTAE